MSSPDTSSLNHSTSGLAAFTVVATALSVLSLVLRFWSRLVSSEVALGPDDWLALGALPWTIGVAGLTFAGLEAGLGRHANELSESEITHLAILGFAMGILFNLSISFSKISAMILYGNMFCVRSYPSKIWRTAYYVTLGLSVAWPVALVLQNVFECTPVQKFWDQTGSGTCIGRFSDLMIGAISSVVIDIAILVVPVWPVYRLHLKTARKLAIGAIFALGYSVPAMSIGRLIVTINAGERLTTDSTYEVIPVLYWIVAECSLSILVICLPAVFHLFRRLYQYGPASLFNSEDYKQQISRSGAQFGSQTTESRYWIHNNRGIRKLSDSDGTEDLSVTEQMVPETHHVPYDNSEALHPDIESGHTANLLMQGIHVTHEVERESFSV